MLGRRIITLGTALLLATGFNLLVTPQAEALTYIRNAWWTSGAAGGETLHITPSGEAQALGIAGAKAMWTAALKKAGHHDYPSSVYHSLYKQLQCHLHFRFKTPYNLDTNRKDEPWPQMLRDKCNPGSKRDE